IWVSPFSFSSLGEIEAYAVTLLKRIRKFSMAQDIGARAAVHIFNRISFAIAKGPMIKPKDAMPWVGLYVAGASLACTLAMAADAFQGFRQWKLWFPNKFFVLNTVSITLIAIAMKLPVDLTTNMSINNGDWNGKIVGIAFLFTMLANFLPSLGLMDDKELLVNMVAWAILLITITVNVSIQIFAEMIPPIFFLLLLSPILWVFSIAFTVPASRRILEDRYKELHGLASYPQEIMFSFKELEHNVKKYWMMAETGNPQFAIACSEVASAFGFICSFTILNSLADLFIKYPAQYSDYNWSLKLLIRFKTEENVSNSNVTSEMKEYAKYVLQIEDDAKLSERITRNALKSVDNQPLPHPEPMPTNTNQNGKMGFKGLLVFDNDQVPPLNLEETKFSWSLVVVTLTAIVVALPNTADNHGEGLVASVREGLQIVRNIEECLDADSDLIYYDACYYHLPCVIKKSDLMKSRDREIGKKREDSVRSAAQLLGRSRKILEILNTRQLPNLDVDSMADIGRRITEARYKIKRGWDQVVHDVDLQKLHVWFTMDWSRCMGHNRGWEATASDFPMPAQKCIERIPAMLRCLMPLTYVEKRLLLQLGAFIKCKRLGEYDKVNVLPMTPLDQEHKIAQRGSIKPEISTKSTQVGKESMAQCRPQHRQLMIKLPQLIN
ncbi:hypothetical protein Tco_0312513, partial [Tanacetum coccineum]